jgi:hypothetical protein
MTRLERTLNISLCMTKTQWERLQVVKELSIVAIMGLILLILQKKFISTNVL